MIIERKKLKHPNISSLVKFDLFPEFNSIDAYFEYSPLNLTTLEIENLETYLQCMYDILKAMLFLQKRTLIHSDIRPEYICYFPKEKAFKLLDKKIMNENPLKTHLRHLKQSSKLYLAPQFFDEILKFPKIKFLNFFKNEIF